MQVWLKRAVFVAATVCVLAGIGTSAQSNVTKNPREGDREAIRAGQEMFRSRCSECHGLDAKGYRGPDLTTMWVSGATDERLFQTIRRGVPGTEMPAFSASRELDPDVWAILAYLKSLNTVVPEANVPGNAEKGSRVFEVNCSGCHAVNGRGGNIGPDLSRIGASRSRALLASKIRTASANIVVGYQPVTLVTREGQRIRAIKKNEDSYSIQVMDMSERLRGYRKADLREVKDETISVMPDFGPTKISNSELDDLLRHLVSLRGIDDTARREK